MSNEIMSAEKLWSELRGIGPVRVASAKMADPERSLLAPAFNIVCGSTDAADEVEREAFERGWTTQRTGPVDVYLDPTPKYELESFCTTAMYHSVWEDD